MLHGDEWINECSKKRIPQLFSYPNSQPLDLQMLPLLCRPAYAWEDLETRKILGICFTNNKCKTLHLKKSKQQSQVCLTCKEFSLWASWSYWSSELIAKLKSNQKHVLPFSKRLTRELEESKSQGSAPHLLIYEACFLWLLLTISRKSQAGLGSGGILFSVPQDHFLHNKHLSVGKNFYFPLTVTSHCIPASSFNSISSP